MGDLPSFLDFEASSLSPVSYPIEVAWSLADGSIESHLISPAGTRTWTDWDPQSQQVHGIQRDELIAHGRAPSWVCRRLNQQLAGKIVYTDNPAFDGMWLAALFSVVQNSKPKFRLGLVDDLLLGRVYPNLRARADALARINALKDEARRRVGGQHRAGWDVQYLIELWKLAGAEKR